MKKHVINGTNETGVTITEPTIPRSFHPSLSPQTTLYLVWKYVHLHPQTIMLQLFISPVIRTDTTCYPL